MQALHLSAVRRALQNETSAMGVWNQIARTELTDIIFSPL